MAGEAAFLQLIWYNIQQETVYYYSHLRLMTLAPSLSFCVFNWQQFFRESKSLR